MGILNALFAKRDLSLTDPKAWYPSLWNLLGMNSSAGINVNENSALTWSTVYRCTKLISDTIASLPLKLYKKLDNGGKEEITDRRIVKILNNPNEKMTHFRFFNILQGHLFIWGNCYIYVSRDNMGRVLGLYILRPDRMEIRERDGNLIYIYHYGTNHEEINPYNLLHIPGFGYDGIFGYSVVKLASDTIGLGLAAGDYGARYFSHGFNPGIVIKHPMKISPETYTSIKKDLTEKAAGLGKSHQGLLLEEGMDISSLGMPHDDAQFLETRQFQNIDFCRFAGVPPHMVFELGRATWNNVEQQSIEWVRDGIRPWVSLWEQDLGKFFLQPYEYGKLFFEFKLEGLLRGDTATRYNAYKIAVDTGWMNRNEVRALENLNPEPELDTFTLPMNMTTMEKLTAEPEPIPAQLQGPNGNQEEEQEEERKIKNLAIQYFGVRSVAGRRQIEKAFYPLFLEAATNIVSRETKSIARAITSHLSERNVETFKTDLKTISAETQKNIKKRLLPVFLAFAMQMQREIAREINLDDDMADEIREFVNDYMDVYIKRHLSSSNGQIESLIDEWDPRELQEVIQTRIDEWSEKRAEKIATNEITRGSNAIATAIGLAVSIPMTWAIVGPSTCPFCRSLEGRRIGGGYLFDSGDSVQVGGENMLVRYPMRHPPLHQGCDCYVAFG